MNLGQLIARLACASFAHVDLGFALLAARWASCCPSTISEPFSQSIIFTHAVEVQEAHSPPPSNLTSPHPLSFLTDTDTGSGRNPPIGISFLL